MADLTKQSLQKALADYERIQTVTPTFYDFEDMRVGNVHRMAAAARFVERLLPEIFPCNDDLPCHSDHQLWDEGLVEVVARTIYGASEYLRFGTWEGMSPQQKKSSFVQARAVLAALTQEVGK